jgi:DNA (cytosine-5)-methyltransferase 1
MNYIIEGSKQFAVLRRLQRRRDIDGTGTPNQLVYTNQTDKVSVSKLQRTCLVRFYSEFDAEKHRIPPPYNRDGTGSAFYITKRWSQEENGISKLIPIEEDLPQTLIQGFDPLSSPPRRILRGMDLYCGGKSQFFRALFPTSHVLRVGYYLAGPWSRLLTKHFLSSPLISLEGEANPKY